MTHLLLASLLLTAPAADKGKVKIAVMDVRGSDNLQKQLLASLTALIPQTLDELGPFKAISRQDVEQMLQLEKMKDSLGCGDISCLAEIGGALGADFLVTGNIVFVGDTYVVQLQLLNIRTSRAEQRVSREYKGGPQGLFDEVRQGTKQLVREILGARSGLLALDVSEEAATVRIDGSIVGVSPLKAVSLAGGAHTLVVEREGFVRYAQDFSVNEKDTTKVSVVLLPSKEFKESYVKKAWLMRGLAIGFTVLGVASIGGGVAATLVGQGAERTLVADMNAYNASDPRDQSAYDTLRSRAGGLQTFDALSIAGFAVGGALTAVGVTLFIVGDAPGKYSEQPATSVRVGAGSVTVVF